MQTLSSEHKRQKEEKSSLQLSDDADASVDGCKTMLVSI